MDHEQRGIGKPDVERDGERLARLEQRVGELERAARQRERSARRSRLLFLLGVALYVLVLCWELTSLV